MSINIHDTAAWIDPNWTEWYSLPEPLLTDCCGNPRLTGPFLDHDWQPIDDFEGLAIKIAEYCDDFDNQFHNTAHGLRVFNNGHEALETLQSELEIVLPVGLQHVILLALLGHDLGHPGKTFFADADAQRVPAGIDPVKHSVEWHSARLLDEYLAEAGATVDQRLLATYIIWSSSYGAHMPQGQRLGIDKIQPSAILGTLMRAADVTVIGDDVTSIDNDMAVNLGEAGMEPDFGSFINNRTNFVAYVHDCLAKFDAATGKAISHVLPWQDQLKRNKQYMLKLVVGQPVATVITKAMALRYGVLL